MSAVTSSAPVRGAVGWVQRFAVDTNSVVERQLCMVVGVRDRPVGLSAALGQCDRAVGRPARRGPDGRRHRRGVRAAGPDVPARAAMVIPLVDLLAVGFLRSGTGGWTSIFSSLLILPVLSLGVEPGRLPLLLGGIVTVGVAVMPEVIDPTVIDDGQWIRGIFTLLVLGLTATVGQRAHPAAA